MIRTISGQPLLFRDIHRQNSELNSPIALWRCTGVWIDSQISAYFTAFDKIYKALRPPEASYWKWLCLTFTNVCKYDCNWLTIRAELNKVICPEPNYVKMAHLPLWSYLYVLYMCVNLYLGSNQSCHRRRVLAKRAEILYNLWFMESRLTYSSKYYGFCVNIKGIYSPQPICCWRICLTPPNIRKY